MADAVIPEHRVQSDSPRCDYLFVVDSDVQLDNSFALKLLIEQNRAVVAPLLIRPYTAWSNFWGRSVRQLGRF